MNDERNREYFADTFSEIEAPSALVGKVLNMTANNEKKARPKIVKKVVIIAAVLTLILTATLVTVATYKVDFNRDVMFGNKVDDTFYDPIYGHVDGTDGVLAGDDGNGIVIGGKIKEEFKHYLAPLPDEEFIFDIPNIIDPEQIALPEDFELWRVDGITLDEREEELGVKLSSNATFFYQGGKTRKEGIDQDFWTRGVWIYLQELYDESELVIVHDGELYHEQTDDGRVDIYYYDSFKNEYSLHRSYLFVGEKYKVMMKSWASLLDQEGDYSYVEENTLTVEEIKAIAESIDNMFYPE